MSQVTKGEDQKLTNIGKVTTVNGDEQNKGGRSDSKITTVGGKNEKITIESNKVYTGREDIRKYFKIKIIQEQEAVTTVTAKPGDALNKREDIDAKVTSVDNTEKEVTTETGEERQITEQEYPKITTGGDIIARMNTEDGDEQCGREENIHNIEKVTTERGDTPSKGGNDDAKVNSVDNTATQVTTERGDERPVNEIEDPKITTEQGDEYAVPQSSKKKKMIVLKPPTTDDNPKQKKINKKRKFDDEHSVQRINRIFLSVDPVRLSNNPLIITEPRDPEMEKCTDSTVGHHSTPVRRDDDVSQSDPSSAGIITCEISSNVKPDLAISD